MAVKLISGTVQSQYMVGEVHETSHLPVVAGIGVILHNAAHTLGAYRSCRYSLKRTALTVHILILLA